MRAYRMEISAEKSNIMVSSRIAPRSTVLMNGERLEEVKSFKYLGSIISSEGDSTEKIRTRINLAILAIAKLKKIWSNNNIKTATKILLYESLVVSVLTYGCESWTLKAEPNKYISNASHHRCHRTTRTAFGHSKTPKTPMVLSYNQTQHTC